MRLAGEAIASSPHAHGIAHGLVARPDLVEPLGMGIDDDGADRFVSPVIHFLAGFVFGQQLRGDGRDRQLPVRLGRIKRCGLGTNRGRRRGSGWSRQGWRGGLAGRERQQDRAGQKRP